MEASLQVLIHPYQVNIVIPAALGEPPVPEGLVANPSDACVVAWMYHGKVGVLSRLNDGDQPEGHIFTLPSTGKGQTEWFDALVGPDIAARRLVLGRAARANKDERRAFERLEVSSDQLTRIRELIAGHVADQEEQRFFVPPQLRIF